MPAIFMSYLYIAIFLESWIPEGRSSEGQFSFYHYFLRVLCLNHVSLGQTLMHTYQTRRIISHHFLVHIKGISRCMVWQCRCIG